MITPNMNKFEINAQMWKVADESTDYASQIACEIYKQYYEDESE